MRSPAAYYFLLLYLTVIGKPLLPVAADWWAHTFDEARHVALVHAKYGCHHLQNEIAAGSQTDHSNNPGLLKAEDSVCVHLSPAICDVDFSTPKAPVSFLSINRNKLPFLLQAIQLPPPKAC